MLLESAGDKLLGESIGRAVAVYYNDTLNSVSFKVGKFLDFDENNLLILEDGKKETVLLPRAKCIRIEILAGGAAIANAKTR